MVDLRGTDVRTTRPGDIVDAHIHLFSAELLREQIAAGAPGAERMRQALETGRWGRRGYPLVDLDAAGAAKQWIERLDDAGIAKAIVVGTATGSEFITHFVQEAAGRIGVLSMIDPTAPDAVERLDADMAAGFKGVKLYPVRGYRLSDPKARPFFARAEELGANMIIHYGVSVDPSADMRFADPIDLSPVARDFPGITFVVAHFGAGWLESVLHVAYQCPNVAVDTSGTNNWIDFMPNRMELADVFLQVVTALGPHRVLFGTDSSNMTDYRMWIAWMQRRIVEGLPLSAEDIDRIMRRNAVELFRLDD